MNTTSTYVSPHRNYKTAYLIIIGLMIVILIGLSIYIIITHTNKTGLFKPYHPQPRGELVFYNGNNQPNIVVPLSKEDEANFKIASGKATDEIDAAQKSGIGIQGLLFVDPATGQINDNFRKGQPIVNALPTDQNPTYYNYLTTDPNDTPVPATFLV